MIRILNVSYCDAQLSTHPASYIWLKVTLSLQFVFGATMCMLAIVQFIRQSLPVYGETRHWQVNRYMKLLIQEGILYFFCTSLSQLSSPHPLLSLHANNCVNGLSMTVPCCPAPSAYCLSPEKKDPSRCMAGSIAAHH